MEVKIALDDKGLRVLSEYGAKELLGHIGSGTWSPKEKAWRFPEAAILDLVRKLKGQVEIQATPEVHNALRRWRANERALDDLRRQWTGWVLSGRQAPVTFGDHPFLMTHQRMAVDIAKLFDRFAFFFDTGTGKSLTALEIIRQKGVRFMIVCPKTLIKGAWLDDARTWYPDMRLLPLSRNIKADEYKELADRWGVLLPRRPSQDDAISTLAPIAHACIINPESFKLDRHKLPLCDGLILDESTLVRNRNATTEALTAYADAVRYCYILSGKPAPNGLMNYFGQMRLVDPAILGKSFYAFRGRYFEQADRFGHVWVPKQGAREAIADRIAMRSIDVRKEDALDLPERTFAQVRIELPPKALKAYKQMERDAVAELESGLLSAPMQLTVMGKLRQMSGGTVVLDDGGLEVLHTAKLAALQEQVDELGDRQCVIWAQYRHEVRDIAEHLRGNGYGVVTANSEAPDVDDSVRAFKAGEVQFIVAHPSTLKFGVTFVNCNTAIYYSRDFDYEAWYQSCDRIYRKGQVNQCTYLSIVAEGTIDEDIERTLSRKGTAAAVMESLINRVR